MMLFLSEKRIKYVTLSKYTILICYLHDMGFNPHELYYFRTADFMKVQCLMDKLDT